MIASPRAANPVIHRTRRLAPVTSRLRSPAVTSPLCERDMLRQGPRSRAKRVRTTIRRPIPQPPAPPRGPLKIAAMSQNPPRDSPPKSAVLIQIDSDPQHHRHPASPIGYISTASTFGIRRGPTVTDVTGYFPAHHRSRSIPRIGSVST